MKGIKNYLKVVSAVNCRIDSLTKKMAVYQNLIKDRQEESKSKFPDKTILEMETIEDWVDMAALAGELKALKFVKAKL